MNREIAVVTGAASGIGLACARRLLVEGARVMLADIDEEAAQRAAAQLVGETHVIPMPAKADSRSGLN